LRELARLLPSSVLHNRIGGAEDTAAQPQGMYITRHLSRSGSPARMIERVQLLGGLAAEAGKPVVNGEPIGAAERDEPGRRLADPGSFATWRDGLRLPGSPAARSIARTACSRGFPGLSSRPAPGVGGGRFCQFAFSSAISLNVSARCCRPARIRQCSARGRA